MAIDGGLGGMAVAVTVSEPVLLVSIASVTTPSGSTVAVFGRDPAPDGVTVKETLKLPLVAPIVTVAPLAVQASTSLTIEHAMLAELVMFVKVPGLEAP